MRCKNCGWENEEGAQVCVKCNSPLQGSTGSFDHMPSNADSRSQESPINPRATVREGFSMDWMHPLENNNRHKNDLDVSPEVKTVKEIDSPKCPKCGYPIGVGMTTCPMCGAYLNDSTSQNNENEKKVNIMQSNSNKQCSNCGNQVPNEAAFCPHCGTALKKNHFGGTVNPWSKPQDSAFFTLRPIEWDGEGVEYTPTTHSGDRIVLNRTNTDPNNNSITSHEQAVVTKEDGHWFIENKSEQKTTMLRIDRKIELVDGDVIVLGNRFFEFKAN